MVKKDGFYYKNLQFKFDDAVTKYYTGTTWIEIRCCGEGSARIYLKGHYTINESWYKKHKSQVNQFIPFVKIWRDSFMSGMSLEEFLKTSGE